MSNAAATINVRGLDQLVKALKRKPPVTRIGILGGKNHFSVLKPGQAMPKSQPTNAEIGAAHEFGSKARGLRERSFLRLPLNTHLDKEIESSGLLDKEVLAEVIKDGSMVPWMKQIAVCAEAVVAKAFASSGDGNWPAWKSSSYSNNTGQLLIDSNQLRNSITSEVRDA